LLPISLLGEQRQNGCEQFAEDFILFYLFVKPRKTSDKTKQYKIE